jgi:hypothetical protein
MTSLYSRFGLLALLVLIHYSTLRYTVHSIFEGDHYMVKTMLDLNTMLRGMAQAIYDEIEAVRKDSKTSSIKAVDGQFLTEENGLYIYQFTLTDLWDFQDDSPITVDILGEQQLKATLVTADGTTVKIAVDEKLPEHALKEISLIDDSTQLLEKMKEILGQTPDSPATLGAKLFALAPVTTHDRKPTYTVTTQTEAGSKEMG